MQRHYNKIDTRQNKNNTINNITQQFQQKHKMNNNNSFVIMIGAFMGLLQIIEEGCKCGGRWSIQDENIHFEGHVCCVKVVCKKCKCERRWESSTKYRDNSFAINRNAVCA